MNEINNSSNQAVLLTLSTWNNENNTASLDSYSSTSDRITDHTDVNKTLDIANVVEIGGTKAIKTVQLWVLCATIKNK